MSGVRSALNRLGSSQSVVLGILCLGVFSTALDQTVVVAALPRVMVDLEIPLSDLDKASWIITGYLISYTVAMPLAGRLSDVYGRVRMFQAALVVFAIGSGLVALAPNFTWIVPARVIQAVGGGATVPIGLAMAVAAVSAEKRGLAIGLVAASAEAGSVVGPLYGGTIIEWIGWRWIFWFDVPQSLLLIGLMAILPNRPNPTAKMDYLGALALGGALTVLTVALAQRSIFTAESIYPYLMLTAGVDPYRRSDHSGETGCPTSVGILSVHLQGVPVVQHCAVSGWDRVDHGTGMRTPHGRHRHGEGAVGERP